MARVPPESPLRQRRPVRFTSRGCFGSSQELIDTVHQLFQQGTPIMAIAHNCGIAYRTVRKVLTQLPAPEQDGRMVAPLEARYVIITERGIAEGSDPTLLEFNPKLAESWVHSSSLNDATELAVRRRLAELGGQYGRVLVARLEFVDPQQFVSDEIS